MKMSVHKNSRIKRQFNKFTCLNYKRTHNNTSINNYILIIHYNINDLNLKDKYFSNMAIEKIHVVKVIEVYVLKIHELLLEYFSVVINCILSLHAILKIMYYFK